MAITFSGPDRRIILDPSTLQYSTQEIYSRWKEWAHSVGPQYPAAFRVVGGDPLGGGQIAPSFYFIRDDLGWKITKPSANIEVTINGNLVTETPGATIFVNPVGFSSTVTVNRSQVSSGTLDGVWESIIADYPSPATAGHIISRILRLAEADEILTPTVATKKDKDTNEDLLVKNVTSANGTISVIS